MSGFPVRANPDPGCCLMRRTLTNVLKFGNVPDNVSVLNTISYSKTALRKHIFCMTSKFAIEKVVRMVTRRMKHQAVHICVIVSAGGCPKGSCCAETLQCCSFKMPCQSLAGILLISRGDSQSTSTLSPSIGDLLGHKRPCRHCRTASKWPEAPRASTFGSQFNIPNIEPKPTSTFPLNETLAVACWDTLVYWTFEWVPDPRLLIREVLI